MALSIPPYFQFKQIRSTEITELETYLIIFIVSASYGSIAGLFLGASLLSVAEILYHAGRKLFLLFPRRTQNGNKKVKAVTSALVYENEFISKT